MFLSFWQHFKSPAPLAVILLLAAGLYVQVWQHTLVWDEHSLTAQQVVLSPSLKHYAHSTQEARRPLALMSVAADRLFWRGWPPGFAVDSLLYHLTVVTLFFVLIRGWVAPFPAAASTLIVALHPVGAETVHYLLGRPDLLSAACILAALLAFRRLDDANRWPVALSLFWGLGVLAFAAKETALLLPCLALVLSLTTPESAGGQSHRRRRYVAALTPFVVLFGLYAAARVGGWLPAGPPLTLHIDLQKLAVMASTITAALNILFWPVDLCPWYEGRIALPSTPGMASGALLIGLAGAVYFIWTMRQRAPVVALGLAWTTGVLVLIALRAAADPAPMNPLAVRWLYPVVIGLALMAGGALHELEPRWSRAGRILMLCVIIAAAGMNWQAQSLWRDDLSVLGRAFHCSPRSPLITLQYAGLLRAAGDSQQAGQLTSALIREQPGHPMVLSRLIRSAIDRGDYREAIDLSRALVRAAPTLTAYRTLGDLLTLTDQLEAAIETYRSALLIQPRDMLTLTALGSAYERTLRWDEAAALYRGGLTRHPEAANLWFRLGRASERAGQLGEAVTAFETTTRFDRDCPDGYLAEARVRRQLGDQVAAADALKRYTALTRQAAVPRPAGDPLNSPCGIEAKVIYQTKTGATSLSRAPVRPPSP